LLVNFDGCTVEAPMDEWKPEEVAAHMDYYRAPNKKLRETGELVEVQALAGLDLAKIVTSDGLTAPVVTDGPFQENAETGWLPPEIALDPKGYVLTGVDARAAGGWQLDRDPYLLETSVPGIFACGDVRFSPVKRVAAAVGEGSMAIAFVHQFLREAGAEAAAVTPARASEPA
jgi:thioredoxin reductase